jgi:hypothetical protein
MLRRHKKHPRREDFSQRQPPLGQPSLLGWCSDFPPKFQGPMKPNEIIMAAKQFEVIFQTLLPPKLTDRSAAKIS